MAAYHVDLAWHGLSRLDSKPKLLFEDAKSRKKNKDGKGGENRNESRNGDEDAQVSSAQADTVLPCESDNEQDDRTA